MSTNIDSFLKELDMHGVLMLQGLLVNRALEILHPKEEVKETSTLLLPNKTIIHK